MKRNYYPFNHKNCVEKKGNKAVLLNLFGQTGFTVKELANIPLGFLCGYVSLEIGQMPKELHLQTNDSYLDFINVPGGITYCEPALDNPDLRKIVMDSYMRKLNNIRNKKDNSFENYLDERLKAKIECNKDMLDLGATHIVYGFDLGHAGHEDIPEYQDTKYVLKICEQMENQLLELGRRYPELEKTEGNSRIRIIDEIRSTAKINTYISPIPMVTTKLFQSKKIKDNPDNPGCD